MYLSMRYLADGYSEAEYARSTRPIWGCISTPQRHGGGGGVRWAHHSCPSKPIYCEKKTPLFIKKMPGGGGTIKQRPKKKKKQKLLRKSKFLTWSQPEDCSPDGGSARQTSSGTEEDSRSKSGKKRWGSGGCFFIPPRRNRAFGAVGPPKF